MVKTSLLCQEKVESIGKKALSQASDALQRLAVDMDFTQLHVIVERIAVLEGSVVCMGVGKAGLIARKWVATLNSYGIRAIFIHPVEAGHGDIGYVQPKDLVIFLSHSGQTKECVDAAKYTAARGVDTVACVGKAQSDLAQQCTQVLTFGKWQESCFLGLAPTISSMIMLVVGDIVATAAARARGVSAQDFASAHPEGAVGFIAREIVDG